MVSSDRGSLLASRSGYDQPGRRGTITITEAAALKNRILALLAICPFCGGTGIEEAVNADIGAPSCLYCGGLGDLDGARLLAAYEAGRKEIIEKIHWASHTLLTAIEEPMLAPDRLKKIV